MRAHVDENKCQGHNRCMIFAPEVFEVDDFGFAHAQNEGQVPPEFAAKARMAAANCPEMAISIRED